MGEEDWFYCSGYDGDHCAANYYHDRGYNVIRGTLYTQKHNRYVNLTAGNTPQILITKPLKVTGKTLQLNVDASRGHVAVWRSGSTNGCGTRPDSGRSRPGCLTERCWTAGSVPTWKRVSLSMTACPQVKTRSSTTCNSRKPACNSGRARRSDCTSWCRTRIFTASASSERSTLPDQLGTYVRSVAVPWDPEEQPDFGTRIDRSPEDRS